MKHTWNHVVEGAAIHPLGPNQSCSCKARHVCQSCQGQDTVNARLLAALEAIAEGRTLVMDDIDETFAQALQRDARDAIEEAKR